MKSLGEQQVSIEDLGLAASAGDSAEEGQGIYALRSLFDPEGIQIPAQGLLDIAAYVEQHRINLEEEAQRAERMVLTDRYYAQHRSGLEYAIRERLEAHQDQPADPIVKVLLDLDQAVPALVERLNRIQHELDVSHGHWKECAAYQQLLPHSHEGPITEPDLPDIAPLRFRWSFPALGAYRPGSKFRLDELPPLPEELFQGTLDWLLPLEGKDAPTLPRVEAYHTQADLQEIITAAQQHNVVLPQAFVTLMRSPELADRIPSCTDCYIDLSEKLKAFPDNIGGWLIRFLIDRQGSIAWYLYLSPKGKQLVVAGNPWIEDISSEEIARGFNVCAFSFEQFLYRFWVENRLWYHIMRPGDAIRLTMEEKRYLSFYQPTEERFLPAPFQVSTHQIHEKRKTDKSTS